MAEDIKQWLQKPEDEYQSGWEYGDSNMLSCKGHYFPICLGKWFKKGWVTLIFYFYIVVLVYVVNQNLILGRNLSWPEGMQHPNANACVQFMDNISIICVI